MKVGKSFTVLLVLGLVLSLGAFSSAHAQGTFAEKAIVITAPAAGSFATIENNKVTVRIDYSMVAASSKDVTVWVGLVEQVKDDMDMFVAATGLTGAAGKALRDTDATDGDDDDVGGAFGRETDFSLGNNDFGGSAAILGRVVILGETFADNTTFTVQGNIAATTDVTTSTTDLLGDKVRLTITLSLYSDGGTASNVQAYALVQNVTDGTDSGLIFSTETIEVDLDGPPPGATTLQVTTRNLDTDGTKAVDPSPIAGGPVVFHPLSIGTQIVADVEATGTTQDDLFLLGNLTAQIRLTVDPAHEDDDYRDIVLPVDVNVRSDEDRAKAQVKYRLVSNGFGVPINVTKDGPNYEINAILELVDGNGNPGKEEEGFTAFGNNQPITLADLEQNIVDVTFDTTTVTMHISALDDDEPDNSNLAPPDADSPGSPGVEPDTDGTSSDGDRNADTVRIPSDGFGRAADTDAGLDSVLAAGLLEYELDQVLERLQATFKSVDGAIVGTINLDNHTDHLGNASLGIEAGVSRFVDFSNPLDVVATEAYDANGDRASIDGLPPDTAVDFTGSPNTAIPDPDDPGAIPDPVYPKAFADGAYDVTYTYTDIAGNVGAARTVTNVWLDVTAPTWTRVAPPDLATDDPDLAVNTVSASARDVAFRLVEAMSIVRATVTEKGTILDDDDPHVVDLVGTALAETGVEHTLAFPNLVDDATYNYELEGRDIYGKWAYRNLGDFVHDLEFVEAIIATFEFLNDGAAATTSVVSDTDVTVTVTATAVDGRGAGTYEGLSTVTATCNDVQADLCAACDVRAFPDCLADLTITGTGVVANGDGTWALDGDQWGATGARDIVVDSQNATHEVVLSILDDTSADGPYDGTNEAIRYTLGAYAALNVWFGPATGNRLPVNVDAWDADNNLVYTQSALLGLSSPQPITLPGTVLLENGVATVWGVVGVGDVTVTAYDKQQEDADADADAGEAFISGSGTLTIGAPASVVGEDYMGADGGGDQGGFVMLTWTSSGSGSYNVWREVNINYDLDADGNLAMVAPPAEGEDPAKALIPWATVAASGNPVERAVVATLDNVGTKWGVNGTDADPGVAKQAFVAAAGMADPYQLMAETMVASRQRAQFDANGAIFAELTPDALSFINDGLVPQFKEVGGGRPEPTLTAEAIRAIDNIAPEPITHLQVLDTPNDQGGSITINWVKSESDLMISRSFGGAVGPTKSDLVAGVKGYGIYRSVFNGEPTIIGQVGAGITTFVDATALNGVTYSYSVTPFDEDNVAESNPTATGLSVRNTVFDAAGVPVQGLFGSDAQVGFDDFFIFADRFGAVVGVEGFDPAFDLAPNNQVDFFDFFVFVENFGRTAVGVGKAVPTIAGLNQGSRIDLYAPNSMPGVGEEMVLNVNLADFVELQGYGLSVSYDADTFEFVRAEAMDNLFGSSDLAQPQTIEAEGEVSLVAYGDLLTEGELNLNIVLRPIAETEHGVIEISRGQLADGSYAFNDVESLGAVSVETRPEVFALRSNYPNPFNPSTTIKYQLPEAADVRLEVFNVVGQVVKTLVAGNEGAGRYTVSWDATNDSNQSLGSGIYFYRLVAGDFQQVNKMLLLK